MRKLLLTVVAIVTAGSLVVTAGAAVAVPRSFWGITPVVFAGNPDCRDLLTGWVNPSRTYKTQLKFALPVNGTNGAGINVTVGANSPVGTGIGWFVTPELVNKPDVRAVIVKGGSSANVYFYPTHPEGDLVDGSLTTPGTLDKNGNFKFPALSYMEFCYFPPGS